MKKHLLSLLCLVCMAMQCLTASALVGNPQVTMTPKEITATTASLTFTPNADVKSYYCVLFYKGTLEQQFNQWHTMMGFNTYGDMIIAWGSERKTQITETWKDLAPNTEYDIYVQCLDQNGEQTPLQCFNVKTINQGGSGEAKVSIDVKEFGQENGAYFQRVIYTPNDQTSRFYDLIITEAGYKEIGGAEGVKQLFKEDYDADPEARAYYAQYATDDARWNAEYATKYHACAIAVNADEQWGPMTDIEFHTQGYVDPNATSIWWGYGDGKTVKNGAGPSSGSQTAAIKIPDEVLAIYDGATMTDIRFAVHGKGSSVSNVSYFVTKELKKFADSAVSVGTLQPGWHEFHLDTPITIHAGEPLYLGYTATGSSPFGLADETGMEGTCYLGGSRSFTDYGAVEGYNWTLAIQAKLQANNFTAQLNLEDMKPIEMEENKTYALKTTVRSMTPVPVTSYTLQLKVDGVSKAQQTIKCNLDEKDAASEYTFTIPALSLGSHTYSVTLLTVNGDMLESPIKKESTIEVKDLLLKRTHVLEECTGTWCGYCPRAIVGVHESMNCHPGEVFAIAVHYDDIYQTSDYGTLLSHVSGYPTVYVNRSSIAGSGSDFAAIEAALKKQYAQEIVGESRIVAAQYTDNNKRALDILVRSRFAADNDNHTYRLAFVVTEDSIYDTQANNFSGSSTAMGGFESMSSNTRIYHRDIARSITYDGIENSIPESVVRGEEYYYRYTLTLPTNIRDKSKVRVAVLLQEKKAGNIVNGDFTKNFLAPGTIDIEGIAPSQLSTANCQLSTPYDLTGRPVSRPAAGQLFIKGGKKYIAK